MRRTRSTGNSGGVVADEPAAAARAEAVGVAAATGEVGTAADEPDGGAGRRADPEALPGRLGPIVRYEQVRLLDVLSQDMTVAREFVIAELGGLASTDARAGGLRTTLLKFLAANRSYQAVARSSHLHKNTVIKRIARADQLIGAPIADRQFEIHAALQLTEVFGDRMLDPTAAPS